MTRARALCMLAGLLCAGSAALAAPGVRAEESPLGALRIEPLGEDPRTLGAYLERGPVLLDFWATWCKPCIAAVPELKALHETHAEAGLTVIGVSVDGPRNFTKVRPFVSRMGIPYPIVLDRDGSLARRFQVNAVPTAVLLDRDGTVVRVQTGYRPGEGKDLEEAIRTLLAAPRE